MESEQAIELANAFSEKNGYSTDGLRANVESPADREFEAVFSGGGEPGLPVAGGLHRSKSGKLGATGENAGHPAIFARGLGNWLAQAA